MIQVDNEMIAVHDIRSIEEERVSGLYYVTVNGVGDAVFGSGDTEDITAVDGLVDVLCEAIAPWAQVNADMVLYAGGNPVGRTFPLASLIKAGYQSATTLSAMKSALEDWGLTMASDISTAESSDFGPLASIIRREGDSLRFRLERSSKLRALYPITYPLPDGITDSHRSAIQALLGIVAYPAYGSRQNPDITRTVLPYATDRVIQAHEIQDEAVHGFDDAGNPPGAWIDRLIAVTEQVPGAEAVPVEHSGNPKSVWPVIQYDTSLLDRGSVIAAFFFERWKLANASTSASFILPDVFKVGHWFAHPGHLVRVDDSLPNLLGKGDTWRVERIRYALTTGEGWKTEVGLRLWQGDMPVGELVYNARAQYSVTGPNHPLGLRLLAYDSSNAVVSASEEEGGVRPAVSAGFALDRRARRAI